MPAEDPNQDADALARAALQELAREVGRFIDTIAGSPSFEMGELIAGHFRYRRLKQGVRQMQKAEMLLADAGLEARQVPMRTLIGLLDGGSVEDDEGMVERWAGLLANAAGRRLAVPPSFPQVLSQLEPAQAHLLDQLYEVTIRLDHSWRFEDGVVPRSLLAGLHPDDFDYHAECLELLGLARIGFKARLTRYGFAFVQACRPPGSPLTGRGACGTPRARTPDAPTSG